jgi:hypothetical protein
MIASCSFPATLPGSHAATGRNREDRFEDSLQELSAMPSSDLNMTWSSFLEHYRKIARDVSHFAAYDYARNRWVDSAVALTSDDAFRQVILTMKDGFTIRIEIVPETRYQLTIARDSVDSPHLWQAVLHLSVGGKELEILRLAKQQLPPRASIPQIYTALEDLARECHQLAERLQARQSTGKSPIG